MSIEPSSALPERPSTGNPLRAVVLSLRAQGPAVSTLSDATRGWALHAIGPGPAAWAAEQGRETTLQMAAMNSQDPLFPLAESNRAAELALLTLLTNLAEGSRLQPSGEVSLLPVIRDAVERNVPIGRIVASIRSSQQTWTGLLVDHAQQLGIPETVIRSLIQAVSLEVDDSVDRCFRVYFAEVERFRDSPEALRRRLVDNLLAGRQGDRAVVRDRLGIQLGDWHVACVLTMAGHPMPAHRQLDRTTAAIGKALRSESLHHHEVEGALWLWATAPDRPDVGVVASVIHDSQVAVGVGSAHRDEIGFRRSHAEALDAVRLVATQRGSSVVLYRDIALLAALSTDLERAAWFVQDQLGALATNSVRMDELRSTLRVHLATHQLVSAAAQLHVHRNTLIHRLRRVEDILGHSVEERVAELHCALLLVDEYGDAVLEQPGTAGA